MNAHNKVPLLVAVCVACLLLLWWQKYTSQNSNEGGGVVRTSVPAEVVADLSEGHSDVSDGRGSRQEVGILDASIDEELADGSANSTEVNTSAIQGFTTEDVEVLRSNLENLYANASRDELIQCYKNAFALMPPGLIEELHKNM